MRERAVHTVAVLFVASALLAGCRHKAHAGVSNPSIQQNQYTAMLSSKTLKADRKRYLRAGRNWKNPTVFVDLSGLFIILGDRGERRPTTIDGLAKELAELPAAAWPLGRVVVLSQSARIPILVEGYSLSEREKQARQIVGRTAEILRSLDVEIVYGPVT